MTDTLINNLCVRFAFQCSVCVCLCVCVSMCACVRVCVRAYVVCKCVWDELFLCQTELKQHQESYNFFEFSNCIILILFLHFRWVAFKFYDR